METFKDMASLFHELGAIAQRASEEVGEKFDIMNNRISVLENDYVREKNKNKQLLNGIKELIENYDN